MKSSKYRGVSYHVRVGKWHSRISYQGTRYHLGYYDHEIDAARAYDKKATDLLADQAKLNNA